MSTVTVDFNQLQSLFTLLGRNADRAMRIGITAAGQRARAMVVERTRTLAFNTGYLARAWKTNVEHAGLDSTVTIYNQAPYAGVVEYGRRPSGRMPPLGPLELWFQRKFRLRGAAARKAAYGLAINLMRRTIPGKHIITDPSFKQTLETTLRGEVVKELRRMLTSGTIGRGGP
jgi:hypothetical protein